MATKYEARQRNRKKRMLKNNVGSVLKLLKNLMISLLLLTGVLGAVTFLMHNKKTKEEIKILSDAGLYNLVEVEDGRMMNAASYGNKDSNYVIVPIAGVGVQDMSVFVQHLTVDIKEHVQLALIDRAGYGFSDDTFQKQTVDQIVNDYRSALKALDIEGPYILLAHEFGGVYATYWATLYPDEISGIMYLDGTIISEQTKILDYSVSIKDRIESALYRVGIQRMMYHNFYHFTGKMLTKQEANCSRAFNIQSVKTSAQLSELSLMKENFETVLSAMEENNIPKLYLNVSNSFETEDEIKKYYEYKNEQYKELGKGAFYDLDQDTTVVSNHMADFIAECKEKTETKIIPFTEVLGNCALSRIPGDTKIYEQKPEGITDAFIDFVWYMTGDTERIKEVYEDAAMIDWEHFDQEHGIGKE